MIKPGLKIVCSKDIDLERVQELIYGIEEEGILYELSTSELKEIERIDILMVNLR